MKKFLLILTLITFTSSNCQKYINVDKRLVPYMHNFIKDGKDRGYDLRSRVLKSIDSIKVEESIGKINGVEILGLYVKGKRKILIKKSLLLDTISVKLTLYHELGHAFVKHGMHTCKDCCDVMGSSKIRNQKLYRIKGVMKLILDDYYELIVLNYVD